MANMAKKASHLLAILILYMAKDNDIFIRSLIEQQGRFCQQGIEPAPGLIHRLRNKLRGELLLKYFFVLKRIVVLGERHCP